MLRNNRLHIFENFLVDQNLKKRDENEEKKGTYIVEGSTSSGGIMMRPDNGWGSIGVDADNSIPMI